MTEPHALPHLSAPSSVPLGPCGATAARSPSAAPGPCAYICGLPQVERHTGHVQKVHLSRPSHPEGQEATGLRESAWRRGASLSRGGPPRLGSCP